MGWRLAKSLETLRRQINEAEPDRSKASDGTIGDEAHASRSSDHNAWVKDGLTGVVTAMDITHDPAHGVDCEQIAEALKRSNDARIKYVIWNKRIWTPAKGKEWRPYTGANPHTKHLHLSVSSAKTLFDDTRPWVWGGSSGSASPAEPQQPTLIPGMANAWVTHARAWLLAELQKESNFGPLMEGLVRGFQKREGLVADGKIGPYTWERLDKSS